MKNTNQTILAVAIMFGFLFFWETFVASRYSHPKIGSAPVRSNNATSLPFPPVISSNGSSPAGIADVLTVLETDNVKASF